ncbi:MAG: histidine phosphatase family protein [Gammaproteobacteria bacterium]
MSNHKLILMRHAKSDWKSSAQTDFDRPLAARGERDAPRMGEWLKKQGVIPDLFLSSPALRARQTACIMADALGILQQAINWDERIYNAGLDDLLDIIDTSAGDALTMLLIGHNPGLDSLLEYFSDEALDYNRQRKLMTTAAIAVIDFAKGPISTSIQHAHLQQLIRPREL